MSIRFGRSGNGYDSSEVMETEDDDWRKVTDLNERRKIQNRLAQRNYRRKLRQRLEELERQAGATSSTASSSANPLKKKKKQSATETGTASGRIEKKSGGGHPVRATKISNLESRPSSQEVTASGASSQSTRATASPRNIYTMGDFGPLFANPEARHQSIRQPEQQLPAWSPQPYPQQQQQQSYEHLAQPYYHASPQPAFSMTPHPHPVSEPATSPPQVQAYISSLQTDSSLPLTHTFSRGEDSSPITHTSYRPNVHQTRNISDSGHLGFPDLPPTYSASPAVNPNPFHLNAPLPRDDFYLTLNYSTLFNASLEIAKILQISEKTMLDDDATSPFNSPSPVSLPEGTEDLIPTKKQLDIEHHPYIDMVPFKGFRDRLLDCVAEGEKTGNYFDESKLCHGMYESWGVWGQSPWEARSWEVGEAFARKYWFLMDEEMIRCTNWWRRQRGMKSLRMPAGRIIGEVE